MLRATCATDGLPSVHKNWEQIMWERYQFTSKARQLFNICSDTRKHQNMTVPFNSDDVCCVIADHRGSVHPAAVLGAAAVGGPAPQGFPPLPLSERVAAQGEPES